MVWNDDMEQQVEDNYRDIINYRKMQLKTRFLQEYSVENLNE